MLCGVCVHRDGDTFSFVCGDTPFVTFVIQAGVQSAACAGSNDGSHRESFENEHVASGDISATGLYAHSHGGHWAVDKAVCGAKLREVGIRRSVQKVGYGASQCAGTNVFVNKVVEGAGVYQRLRRCGCSLRRYGQGGEWHREAGICVL